MPDDHGYSHQEVRLIFERAGKLDALGPADRRRSLAEIQAIGAEAGLDPRDIAAAAATVRPAERYLFTGAPYRFRASSALPPLGEQGIVDVVTAVREATGLHGKLQQHPLETEWRVRAGLGAIVMTFAPRANGTRVNVLVIRDDARSLTVISSGIVGTLLGVSAGAFVGHSLGVGVAAGIATGLATFAATTVGLARVLWASTARRWKERTDDLARTIERAGAKSAAESSDAEGN
jgi:hypothetical protein